MMLVGFGNVVVLVVVVAEVTVTVAAVKVAVVVTVVLRKDEQSELALTGRVVFSLEPVPVRARKQLSGVQVTALSRTLAAAKAGRMI
jgi:hypothetical protein